MTDQIGEKFKDVTGYKNYRVFSNWNYERDRGMVRIYHDLRDGDGKYLHEWIGQEEDAKIGEFTWIGEDTLIQQDSGRRTLQRSANSTVETAGTNVTEEVVSGDNETSLEDPDQLTLPNFSHLIIAMTQYNQSEDTHHINFYKVIEHELGRRSVFEYKIDAIQASLGYTFNVPNY